MSPRRSQTDLMWLAVAARSLFVVVLWIAGHNMGQATASPGGLLVAAGRITGLVAADLLLVQVALMARIPWLERSFGQDRLASRHRLVGFWSFNLVLAHVTLITVGYSLLDHRNPLSEGWNLIWGYGGMLLALLSLLCLSIVAVTSVRAARRALRYESWHLLHLYAYIGVATAVPHQIWTGADFRTSVLAREYWVGSYLLLAAAVLWFRLVVPIRRSLAAGVSVTSIVRESSDVVTVHLSGPGLDRLGARAGQFFIWRFLDGPGWSRGHPYSLSAAPRPGHLQITAKDLGDGSRRLADVPVGTKVLLEGPYGQLTGTSRSRDRLVMFACGIGITPLRALLEEQRYLRGDATLIYRARSHADLVLKAEIDALAQARQISVHYLLGPRQRGPASWLPKNQSRTSTRDALRRLAPHLLDSDVFVCGPQEWMDAVCRSVLDAGLAPEQLHCESFSW